MNAWRIKLQLFMPETTRPAPHTLVGYPLTPACLSKLLDTCEGPQRENDDHLNQVRRHEVSTGGAGRIATGRDGFRWVKTIYPQILLSHRISHFIWKILGNLKSESIPKIYRRREALGTNAITGFAAYTRWIKKVSMALMVIRSGATKWNFTPLRSWGLI